MGRRITAALLTIAAVLVVAAAGTVRVVWVAGRAERWIADRLSAELGRPVVLEEVELSLSDGLDLRVRGLRVGEDSAFANEDFLAADEARLHVALLPALLGRAEIEGLTVEGARLRLLHTEHGWNVASLRPRHERDRDGAGAPPSSRDPATPFGPIEIRGAEITIEDATGVPPQRLVLRDGRIRLAGGHAPIEFRATSAPFAAAGGVLDLSATISPPGAGGELAIGADFVLGPITFTEARSLPWISRVIPTSSLPSSPVTLRGRLRAMDAEAAVDAEGELGDARFRAEAVLDLAANELRLDLASLPSPAVAEEPAEGVADASIQASFRFADAPPRLAARIRAGRALWSGLDLRDLDASLVQSDGTTRVESFSFAAFGGRWNGSARHTPGSPAPLEIDASVDGLSIASVFAGRDSAPPIDGRIDAAFSVTAGGTSCAEIEKTLRGDGYLEVEDGTVRAAEVADQILEATIGLSGVAGLVPGDLRARHPELFAASGAPFERFTAAVAIDGGRLRSDELALATADYALAGAGSWSVGGELAFEGTFLASRELTDDLVRSFGRGASLAGPDGRLSVPIRIAGTVDELRAGLDDEFLSGLLARD